MEHLDNVLKITGEKLLTDTGKMSHAQAIEKAKREYQKYTVQNLLTVEKAYLKTIKEVEKTVKEKNFKRRAFFVDIETAATSTIKNRIADTDRLSQFINEGDKEPIWDGAIYAYKSKSRSNDNIIGKAPVQVKGKEVKAIQKDKITYRVSVTNLKQFRDDGGVLYFVVYISEDKQKKIYYAMLLPFLLNQYITVAHGKTTMVNLKELPDKDNDFENIVINFINERKKQIISKNGKNWTIQEVIELLGKDNVCMNFNYTCIGYDVHDPFSYLKDNEIYLYAGNQEGSLSFPVEHIENVEMMVYEPEVSIFANGHHYYNKIKVEYHRDERIVIYIGKSFRYLHEENKITLKYNLEGNLNEQIDAIKFLLDVIDDKGLYINGIKYPVEPSEEELRQFSREREEGKLKYLLHIKEMLDKLGVSEPLELGQVTQKQEDYIRMLINCLLNGKRAGFNEKGDIPPLGTITIGNLRIMLLFRQMEDERYEINDFFRYKVNCKLDREGNYDTTQFCMLMADDYLRTSNLDVEIIKKSFKEHRNKGHFERMALCILEMLKAYDRNKKRKDLLDMALGLNCWLQKEDSDNVVHKINLYQCYKRCRNLNDNEIEDLNEMFLNSENNNAIKAAIQILLNSKRLADIYINKLSDDERDTFLDYPIYNLYKELK